MEDHHNGLRNRADKPQIGRIGETHDYMNPTSVRTNGLEESLLLRSDYGSIGENKWSSPQHKVLGGGRRLMQSNS
jgi:hypothetical protein